MFSYLLRILILATIVIWLLRQLLALFAGSKKKSGRKSTPDSAANYMVKDPVCGMYMDSRLAVRLENGRETTYFCSEECKNRFLDRSSEGKSVPDANR
jgi:YHS domain-containing protein